MVYRGKRSFGYQSNYKPIDIWIIKEFKNGIFVKENVTRSKKKIMKFLEKIKRIGDYKEYEVIE